MSSVLLQKLHVSLPLILIFLISVTWNDPYGLAWTENSVFLFFYKWEMTFKRFSSMFYPTLVSNSERVKLATTSPRIKVIWHVVMVLNLTQENVIDLPMPFKMNNLYIIHKEKWAFLLSEQHICIETNGEW